MPLWSCTRCHPREVRNQCSQSEPMQHLPCAQYRVDKRGDFGACTTAKPRINLADWRSQYTPLATSSARRQCGYHTKHGATPTVLGGLLGHIRMRSLHAAVRVHAETAVISPDVARTGCQDRRLLQTPYSCSCLTVPSRAAEAGFRQALRATLLGCRQSSAHVTRQHTYGH